VQYALVRNAHGYGDRAQDAQVVRLLVGDCQTKYVLRFTGRATMIRSFQVLLLALLCNGTNAETKAYFGDLHLHTTYSNDAIAFMGTTRTPDDAYRFAKGKAIKTNDGRRVKINQPLDFLAVTEHMRFLGALQSMTDPDSAYRDSPAGKLINSTDPRARAMAFLAEIAPWGRPGTVSPSEGVDVPERADRIWRDIVATADQHYQPGKFTTFAGYEWTAEPRRPMGGPLANMHRVVLFEDTKDLPYPFSAVDSVHPERLWEYLEAQRLRGIDAIAIPHNTNISDGLMYAPMDSYGKPLTEHYAARRSWNEPVTEVTQLKGTSETHPTLSPNDEFAGFELRRALFGSTEEGRLVGSYVRDAYKRGLEFEAWGFFNPFQFGMIGATDQHAGLSLASENRVGEDPEPATARAARSAGSMGISVGGLTGVWAEDNRRELLFNAMRRRETFATTGSRISVRFFAGEQYAVNLLTQRDWVEQAYNGGVPMGSELVLSGSAPRFVVFASKDPNGANLDRIQLVKGWVENGRAKEKIYNVAVSDGRTVSSNGGVEPVGNTVELATATYTNDIGDATLGTVWEDPNFDPRSPAFYYLRVLEIPTPRWQVYDAVAARTTLPKDGPPSTIQERAFTSPIWYAPQRPREP
jgi:hypothetical protein